MFNNLSVRTALTLATAIFVALVLLVGGVAFTSLSSGNAALRSMYSNDLTASSALSETTGLLLRCRSAKNRYVSLIKANNEAAADKQLALAATFCAQSQKAWDAFSAVPVDAATQSLLDDAKTKHQAMMDKGIMPEFDALKSKDFDGYDKIQLQFSSPLYGAFDALVKPLSEYTANRAQQRYDDAQSRAHTVNILLLISAIVAVVIGVIVRRVLSSTVVDPVNRMIVDFARISKGDLATPVVPQGTNEIGQLQSALQHMQAELAGTVRDIRSSTESISVASGEIASGNMDLSSRTEQQAASLQETAASMEELSGTVRQNADNARQASTLALSASELANKGDVVVKDVIATMHEINDRSGKIADIISIIEGIAFQTNILALNAAVEAARAGEEGRGFAVVAGEVRTLAQRSSSAAKEIKALIDASVDRVQAGTQLVGEAGTTMNDVKSAVRRVTDIMTEISSATDEQSNGIEQISLAVQQMDGVTQQNAALVEEAAAAAQSLEQQASRLRNAVAIFRL